MFINFTTIIGCLAGEILKFSDSTGQYLQLTIDQGKNSYMKVNYSNNAENSDLRQLCGCSKCRDLLLSMMITITSERVNINCNNRGNMILRYKRNNTKNSMNTNYKINSLEFRNSAYIIYNITFQCWYELPFNHSRIMFQILNEGIRITKESCHNVSRPVSTLKINKTKYPWMFSDRVSTNKNTVSNGYTFLVTKKSTLQSNRNTDQWAISSNTILMTNTNITVTNHSVASSVNNFQIGCECTIWKAVAIVAMIIIIILIIQINKRRLSTFVRKLKNNTTTDLAILESLPKDIRHSLYSTIYGCDEHLGPVCIPDIEGSIMHPCVSTPDVRPTPPPRDKAGTFMRIISSKDESIVKNSKMDISDIGEHQILQIRDNKRAKLGFNSSLTKSDKYSQYSSITGYGQFAESPIVYGYRTSDVQTQRQTSEKRPSLPLRNKAGTFKRIISSTDGSMATSDEITNVDSKMNSVFQSLTGSSKSKSDIYDEMFIKVTQ